MMRPLKFHQKVIAYSALVTVLLWTVFGVFAIVVILIYS